MNELLTPREFATRIKVQVRTVWRWIRTDVIPARNRGSEENPRYLCDEASFNAYLRKKTRPANAQARRSYPEYNPTVR